jgi:hypothetical protein
MSLSQVGHLAHVNHHSPVAASGCCCMRPELSCVRTRFQHARTVFVHAQGVVSACIAGPAACAPAHASKRHRPACVQRCTHAARLTRCPLPIAHTHDSAAAADHCAWCWKQPQPQQHTIETLDEGKEPQGCQHAKAQGSICMLLSSARKASVQLVR